MRMQEIKGFPDYMFNVDTGAIVSKLKRHTELKLRTQNGRNAPFVQMVQEDGKRRSVFYWRLMYAMQNGVGYDKIPDGYFIMRNDDGTFTVSDGREHIDIANNYVKAARKRERIKNIDQRIREMSILRRAYVEGSHIEAVQYIESRKSIYIGWYRKKYGANEKNAEIVYAQALEWMIRRIDSPDSQVLELSVNMMGLMRKTREKMRKERPLYLPSERASNSEHKTY
jgi:hypothetical protein